MTTTEPTPAKPKAEEQPRCDCFQGVRITECRKGWVFCECSPKTLADADANVAKCLKTFARFFDKNRGRAASKEEFVPVMQAARRSLHARLKWPKPSGNPEALYKLLDAVVHHLDNPRPINPKDFHAWKEKCYQYLAFCEKNQAKGAK